MRLLLLILIAILALLAGVAQSGLAALISISDVYPGDANVIYAVNPQPNNLLFVYENYGETHRVPYPSHDGLAIVNASGRFFDKVVHPVSGPGNTQLYFVVTNNGPYTWSDYHFEIYDPTFTTRLAILQTAGIQSPYLQHIAYTGTGPWDGVNFWTPTDIAPGHQVLFFLAFYSDAAFGVRQVATTVPLPGAVWLLGGGLAGLLGLRGFRRRS